MSDSECDVYGMPAQQDRDTPDPATPSTSGTPRVTPAMVNERILTLMDDISTKLTAVARTTARTDARSRKQLPKKGGARRDPTPSDSSSSSDRQSEGSTDGSTSRDRHGSSDSSPSDGSSSDDAPDGTPPRRQRRHRRPTARDVRRAERTMRRLGLPGRKKKSSRKSGLARGAEVNVRHIIDWPHHLIRRQGEAIQFEQMSVQELTAGLLAMAVKAEGRGRARWAASMRSLSHRVLEDAGRILWPAVRRSVREVFLAIEQGRMSWDHFHRLNRFRQTEMLLPVQQPTPQATPRAPQAAAPTSARATGTAAPRRLYPCIPYQTGECTTQQASHQGPRGKVKHICAHCAVAVTREYAHPESDCRRKAGGNTATPTGQ